MKPRKSHLFLISVVTLFLTLLPASGQAQPYKVLVVFSYGESYPWVVKIKAGIDSVLAETSEIKYFYMNTKGDIEGGPQKAQEAFAIYRKFKPDGVIVADDNAQAMFVVPFLKDKVKTPVIFCGVNAPPEKYGYPASNVSGVLERMLFGQSIALAQKLAPSAKTVACMGNDSPTTKAMFNQIKKDQDSYSARVVAFEEVKTVDEMVAAARKLRETADLLYLVVLRGLKDENGNAPDEIETIPALTKAFGKPIISELDYYIKCGALCGVLMSPRAHGTSAAKMLLKAMQGTPMTEIPISTEIYGKQMINADMLRALKIRPNPNALRSAELVRLIKP